MDVNPKSIKTEELYGFISMATREWKDGLLSKARSTTPRVEDCQLIVGTGASQAYITVLGKLFPCVGATYVDTVILPTGNARLGQHSGREAQVDPS